MKSFNFIAIFFIILFNINPCQAQFKIKLEDVTEFNLERRGGGLSDYHEAFKVIFKNNVWKCYQPKPVVVDEKTATIGYHAPLFIRDISTDTLRLLLSRLAVADTVIDIRQFNLDKRGIISEYDSLVGVKIKPGQKVELAKAVQTGQLLNKVISQLLHPLFEADDKNSYTIDIATKEHVTYHAFAYSFAYPYDLPWTVGFTKTYDPAISVIFNQITGHPAFDPTEHKRLQQNIALTLYRNEFQTRFNFDNLRTDYPASFKILNNTFIPIKLTSEVGANNRFSLSRHYDGIYSGVFTSSRLPRYVQLSFDFNMDDIDLLNRVKRYEDTLVRCFQKDNFLFYYLKTRSNYKVTFEPTTMWDRGQDMFKRLRVNFPGIAQYDYKETQLITVTEGAHLASIWMLLPDNTLLLCYYKSDGNNTSFMDIDKVLARPGHAGQQVCIIFNSSGKLLHDYGVVKAQFFNFY